MTYQETLKYLYSQLPMFQRIGKSAYRNDLDNIIALCEELQNPEQKFKSIHIAGTNGKGSTSHMIASVLQTAGYKVGLYTSPHLKSFTERIRINGQEISQGFVIDFVEKVSSRIQNIKPSFFEITVAMAFDYFTTQKVDVAIIEVGMGGRLDATNVINPLISLITNIGLDHQQFLGDTLEKIATEKAGIVKTHIPLIVSQKQKETTQVFQQITEKNESELFFATDEKDVFLDGQNSYAIYNKKTKIFEYQSLELDLLGNYQRYNLLGVLKAVELLQEKNLFDINQNHIKEGLQNVVNNTGLKGRWQILQQNPLIICDVGHNEDGIKQIVAQLETYEYKDLRIVFGVSEDKDLGKILPLLPKDAIFYFCKPDVPRGMDAKKLFEIASQYNLKGKVFDSVREAVSVAKSEAFEKDLIFVGGSVFVVAEVI